MPLHIARVLSRVLHFNDPANVKTVVGLLFSAIAYFVLLFLPPSVYGMPDLTLVERRMVAIFVTAALLWVSEAVPTWVTSVIIIMVMLLTVSDSSLLPLVDYPKEQLGELISYKSILATFSDPVIILFIGGFILAIGVGKVGLDAWMAKQLLRLFGTRSEFVLLGFIIVTALFSAFISNTATAAMMLAFLGPVLRSLPANGKGRIALCMAIPLGANIGGMATPIGTPPNGIAMKYLNMPVSEGGLGMGLTFGDWAGPMLPITLLVLVVGWLIILWMFPFNEKHIKLEIKSDMKKSYKMWMVSIAFALTVLVWFTGQWNGIDANVAAFIPVTLLCLTGVINKKDLESLDWSVLWMVAGGFALGLGFNKSGLAHDLVTSIPFHQWSPLAVIVGAGLICWLLSNFISNSATAALLVPILCAVGTGMSEELASIGGTKTLLMGIAMAASLAMTLPISTPPNAIAHSTGMIRQSDMAKAGGLIGVLGFIMGYLLLIFVF